MTLKMILKKRIISCSTAPLTFLAGALIACSGDTAITHPNSDLENMLWRLQLSSKAITMAVGETLQLTATPLTINGEVATTNAIPSFRSLDTMVMTVDSSGKVLAKDVSSSVLMLIATISSPEHKLTRADTAWVTITNDHQVIESFKIGSDADVFPIGVVRSFAARVTDPSGDTLSDLQIRYWTDQPSLISIDPISGLARARNFGKAKVYATTTSYGVTRNDSVALTIEGIEGQLVSAYYLLDPYRVVFEPDTVRIKAGQSVTWKGVNECPGFTFEDPSQILPPENIAVKCFAEETRVFPVPGVYRYELDYYSQEGVIIVE